MKKILLAVMLLYSTASIAQSTWAVDAAHSKVTFDVSHMMISDVEGYFKLFDGQMTASKEDFTDAVISFNVDAGSINTDNEKRDGHLKSDDFFNAEKYPKITFKSTSFKKVSGNKYLLTGNLTIRDVTKPVTLDVTYNGTVMNPYKMTVAGFKATGSINRFDYGLKFNAKMDNGSMVVADIVNIVCNIEMIKK